MAAVMVMLFGMVSLAATYSEYWKQDANGIWYVQKPDGTKVVNAWLCDDAVPENGKEVWYLLDANGQMISAGLVQDGTGNYYSIETEHNGYYGMLRYKSGNYGGVNLQLEGSHNGSFAAIKNADGIAALNAKFGLKSVANINNNNCVYTSTFGGAKTAPAAGGSSSGSVTAAIGTTSVNVQLINVKTLQNYPGNFRIVNPTDNGWEEYYSQNGILPSYVYKVNGRPLNGWFTIDGVYWCSPAAQIDTPYNQEDARRIATGASVAGDAGSVSVTPREELAWRPQESEVDKRAVAEYFIELVNEYRESRGIAPLEMVEEQMAYAQERADRDSVSHAGNTAAAEICCCGIMGIEPFDAYGYEKGIAWEALNMYKESSGHDAIVRSKKYTKIGAGFLLKVDAYGGVYGFTCEANFEK